MTPRAVLFDLDGTLVDSAPAIAAALSKVRAERGAGPIRPSQVRPWISLGAQELVRRGLGEASQDPAGDLAHFRQELTASPSPADSVYPGVLQLLAGLKGADFRLAVVTNKPVALARRLMEELELADAFKAVVGGDSVDACKPDPAPTLAALCALETTPDAASFVGDSLIDAEAAAALDIPFHLFEGGYGATECAGVDAASRFTSHLALLQTLVRTQAPQSKASA